VDGLLTVRVLASVVAGWSSLSIFSYAIWLVIQFFFCLKIREKRDKIREEVISYWSGRYRNLSDLFDNVLVEHLRVIGQLDEVEGSRTKHITILFFILSVILLLGGFALVNSKEDFLARQGTPLAISIIVFSVAQIISLAFVWFSSYYEFKYYKVLRSLEGCSMPKKNGKN